ncbi:hypothetical protein [Sphingosinicella sp. CPCC 101087]|uniref:hypothetical protein n=1 Tax=Sphingosinicella sp. CPCC 101087 TaxID=2497754 RepID=UPI00101C9ABE|nr:hypothetical protein [Sphingosinicella sp. CPCC 101087]
MLDWIAPHPVLDSLPINTRKIVLGLRAWAVTARLGRCSLHAAAEPLGSQRAAAHLHLMVGEIRELWPEPFAVSGPCCAGLTHDEAVLAEMLRLGNRRSRLAFDRLLEEMIGAEGRERLFISACVLMQVME